MQLGRARRLVRGRAGGGPGRACGRCATPGWCARTTAGASVAFPLGAVLVAASLVALAPLAPLDDRADLDLLDPELRRWFAYVARRRLPRAARRRARPRRGGATRARGWRGPRPRRALRAALDRRDQGGRRARPRRLRDLRARAARRSTTSPTWRCCCWRPTCSTCSTCARAGPRRRFAAGRRRPLPRLLDGRAARAARPLHRPGRWSAPGSRCASGRCSATPARTWSAR